MKQNNHTIQLIRESNFNWQMISLATVMVEAMLEISSSFLFTVEIPGAQRADSREDNSLIVFSIFSFHSAVEGQSFGCNKWCPSIALKRSERNAWEDNCLHCKLILAP